MTRLGSILLWSAIAAAFIGPGTVTASASAGAGFGLSLLWAVLFSGFATYVLQEFAARLAIASGRDLAEVLRHRYARGWRRAACVVLIGGAILLGCAAYEAGNILGGAAGAMLAIDLPQPTVALAIGVAAAVLLATGSPRRIASIMALFVALMGIGFLLAAVSILFAGGLVWGARGAGTDPLVPILALIGTTVVPYNLFLGAALACGQGVAEMRIGLAVSVALGVLITAGVLVVGTTLTGEFSFEALGDALALSLGEWARTGFALGLFAAGISSAITAPLAAALTARGLFGWGERSAGYHAVWAAVLLAGLGFGVADIRPVPAIIAAQAFNGMILPLVALFLLWAMNDRRLLGEAVNGRVANLVGALVVAIAGLLGTMGIVRAASATLGSEPPSPGTLLAAGLVGGVGLAIAGLRTTRG
ncbi:NRAMP family divalent metal transporter [Qipengyuania sp. MTN3-11]|uniref:NRAMP family divalent metal transporter n=1 Tax=Qipengyuania sp. MTN3-11 TaxID=3056557 RepID=UPI0036F31448